MILSIIEKSIFQILATTAAITSQSLIATERSNEAKGCFSISFILLLVLANKVSVAVAVVDFRYIREELRACHPRQREGGLVARVWM